MASKVDSKTVVYQSSAGRQAEGFRVGDVVKTTSFSTKEGMYTHCSGQLYSRPNRLPFYSTYSIPVHVSLGQEDYILFNVGNEAYVYTLASPGEKVLVKDTVDKWYGKNGQVPLCHDVNGIAITSELLPVVLGFRSGAIAYYNPLKRKNIATLNQSPAHDASGVIQVRWQPGEKFIFSSAHRSGHLYFWTVESTGGTSHSTGTAPTTGVREIQDAVVKVYPKGNLLQRWSIGHGAINNFSFSPDGIYIAVASQDGFMRIYNVQKLEFYGRMRSYFGGFLCVCWSPDSKYVVTGGEDDLVTVWSFEERCVVTRCEGHSSWVGAVSFDPYLYTERFKSSSQNTASSQCKDKGKKLQRPKSIVEDLAQVSIPAYRLASVGEDGCLLLWDLTADALRIRHPLSRGRSVLVSRNTLTENTDVSVHNTVTKTLVSDSSHPSSPSDLPESNSRFQPQASGDKDKLSVPNQTEVNHTSHDMREAVSNPNFQLRKHQRYHSGGDVSSTTSSQEGRSSPSGPVEGVSKGNKEKETKAKLKKEGSNSKMQKIVKKVSKKVALRTQSSRISSVQFETYQSDDVAPSMDEVNMLTPLVNIEISPERLTDINFTEHAILVACHHGYIQVWQRPGVASQQEGSQVERTDIEKH